MTSEALVSTVVHRVGNCETSRETLPVDRLGVQDAAPSCANTRGPLTPPEPCQNLGTAVMLPRPSVHLAAFLVNAAHDQLSHARRSLFRALEKRAAEPGRKTGECGTPAGYRRHQRAEDAPCWACTEANNWDKRRRSSRGVAR